MKCIRLTTFLLALIWILPSSAGIRGVLGGGGYSEMVVLNTISNLSEILRPFTVAPLSERFNQNEVTFLQWSLQKGFEKSLEVVFVSAQEAIDSAVPNTVGVSKDTLYDTNGEAVSLKQLVGIALRAWLSLPEVRSKLNELNIDSTHADRIVAQIGDETVDTVKSDSVRFAELGRVVHIFSTSEGAPRGRETSLASIWIESEDLTVDLTPGLISALRCNGPAIHLLELFDLRPRLNHLILSATWQCGPEVYTGRAVIDVAHLSEPILVSQMRPLSEVTHATCGKLLAP